MEWSPPSARILGFGETVEFAAGRLETTLCALSSCLKAMLLSNHVRATSPQSTMVAQSLNTSSPVIQLMVCPVEEIEKTIPV